ncbi:MAG: VWA domain-containing protein [Myxococcales bacterium]|nr:VWA domain-containing protein [Myxococcales bacterium]
MQTTQRWANTGSRNAAGGGRAATTLNWNFGLASAPLLALAIGCAAGDSSGGDTRGGSDNLGLTGDPSSGDPGATASSPSSFGNSSTPAAATTTTTVADGGALEDGCEVGERCGPVGPDPDDCGSLTLESEAEIVELPGNVLLVFDRSGSMAQEWNGQPRWEVAGQAIDAALTPLSDRLTIGSVFFPSSDPDGELLCPDPTGIACAFVPGLLVPAGTCSVNPITEIDQIDFSPGPSFLTTFVGQAMTAPLYAPVPQGRTPLKEALQEANTALNAATLDGITSVVVITDGEPNCEWDAATSLQIVGDWAAQGIRTYVVGLPGVNGNATAVLNDLAMTGGTGQYISPADPGALEQALRDIATETVRSGFDSCDIIIDPPAEAPDKLHLVVTEGGKDQDVARDLGEGAGWTITDDGSSVTLEGALCDDATDGRFEALRFEFGCVDLPPLPPPMPPE